MKPRFKMFWLREDGEKETNGEFVNLLDDGWMVTYTMPTEKAVWVVLSKMTDALDGLTMSVSATTGSNEIGNITGTNSIIKKTK